MVPGGHPFSKEAYLASHGRGSPPKEPFQIADREEFSRLRIDCMAHENRIIRAMIRDPA